MRLHKVKVKNFRKLKDCEVEFRDATFLVGPNNTGKSSLFEPIKYLHGAKNVTREDYSKTFDENEGDYVYEHQIEITAEYRNVPDDADQWHGFRGRVYSVDDPFDGETDKAIKYKKTYSLDKSKPQIFLQEHKRSVSATYKDCTLVSDLEGEEYGEEFPKDFFGPANYGKALTVAATKLRLFDLPGYWDIDSNSELSWVENPCGIPGNVLSKLPRVVPIPAESCTAELTSQNGALLSMLTDLFAQVRSNSDNYRQAQEFLNKLAEELDPADGETDFGKLMGELNNMTHQLFPESAVHVSAQLDQPDKNIKPQFTVEMESNVKTAVSYVNDRWAVDYTAIHWSWTCCNRAFIHPMLLAVRSENASLFRIGLLSNLPMLGAVFLAFLLQMMVIYLPALNTIFHTQPLPMFDLVVCLALSSSVLFAVEISKWLACHGFIYKGG